MKKSVQKYGKVLLVSFLFCFVFFFFWSLHYPNNRIKNTVEFSFNVTKRTEYFVSLYTGVVITEEYNVTVNSQELIVTAENLTL